MTQTKEGESRGNANEFVNWISNSSEPSLIPPQYGGSTRSKLITMLEDDHYEVKLSREEMDILCAWIDLVVPFCGDYVEPDVGNGRFKLCSVLTPIPHLSCPAAAVV